MKCESCGRERGDDDACLNCGHPGVDAETAEKIARASDALAAGDLERALRDVQPVLRDNPAAFLPHLILARVYHRMARSGKPGLPALVDREFGETVRLLPPDRRAHMAAVQLAAELGKLETFDAAYRARFGSLPFAAEVEGAIGSAIESAPRTVRSFSLPGRTVTVLLAGLALGGGIVYLAARPPANPGEEAAVAADAAAGGEEAAPRYVPGANLLTNGNAGDYWDGWERRGNPSIVEEDDNPFFRLNGDPHLDSALSREIRLPSPRPRWVLVVARTRAGHEPEDGMTGLPYLWGDIRGADGEVFLWLNDERTMHRGRAGEWGVCWGVFESPPGTGTMTLRLRQALKTGGTRAGTHGDFDDVGVFLFNSRMTARDFAERYTGDPPTGEFAEEIVESDQDEMAKDSGEGKTYNPRSTNRDENLEAATSMYERLKIGMSFEEAEDIMGLDSRNHAWAKDFGPYGNPATVTLRVYFLNEKAVRVELTSDYETRSPVHPDETIAEKGLSREEAERD